MMKKASLLSMVAIAIILSVSFITLGTYGDRIPYQTVLGITLGKSLSEAGLPECRRSEGPYSFKEYDPRDTNCYRTIDCERDSCFTQVIPELSFDLTVDVVLLDHCDRQSPVQEIRAAFDPGNYEKVLPLVIDRFGQPKKTQKSMVQDSVGVIFQKIESFWDKKGISIYITNRVHETGLGRLEIIRPDKKRRLAQNAREEAESDRKLF